MILNCFCNKTNPKKNLDYILEWIDATETELQTLNAKLQQIIDSGITRGVVEEIANDYIQHFDWTTVGALVKQKDLIKDSYITIKGSQMGTYTYQINVANTDGIINAINANNLEAGHKWYMVAYTFGSNIKYGLFSFTYLNASDPTNSSLNIVVRFDGREVTVNNVARNTVSVQIDLRNGTSTILTTSTALSRSTVPITSGGVYDALQDIKGLYCSDTNTGNFINAYVADADDGDWSFNIDIRNNYDGQHSAAKSVCLDIDNIEYLNTLLQGIDNEPTEDSNKLVTSGAVYTALNNISLNEIRFVDLGKSSSKVSCGLDDDDHPIIELKLNAKTGPRTQTNKTATITLDNIDNLKRALEKPDDTPIVNSDNLITSGAVYQALNNKVNLRKLSGSEKAAIVVDADGEGGTIELYVTDGNGNGNSSTIDSSNIGNLNRALENPDTTPTNTDNKLITSRAVYNATLYVPNVQTKFVYDTVQSKWRLVNIGQLLEQDAEFDSPILSKCEVTKSEKTFYTYACINKTLESLFLVVRFYIDGNVFEWSDRLQSEGEAEGYRFDDDLYVDKISSVY